MCIIATNKDNKHEVNCYSNMQALDMPKKELEKFLDRLFYEDCMDLGILEKWDIWQIRKCSLDVLKEAGISHCDGLVKD